MLCATYLKVMEHIDSLSLSIIFLNGYDAAKAREPRIANPFEGSLANAWFEGRDEGYAVFRRVGDALRPSH